ncbi:unnamed protein product, partial [Protopolystoma xenopodis]
KEDPFKSLRRDLGSHSFAEDLNLEDFIALNLSSNSHTPSSVIRDTLKVKIDAGAGENGFEWLNDLISCSGRPQIPNNLTSVLRVSGSSSSSVAVTPVRRVKEPPYAPHSGSAGPLSSILIPATTPRLLRLPSKRKTAHSQLVSNTPLTFYDKFVFNLDNVFTT